MSDRILFEEVTNTSGIDYLGQSYGASWGNYDRDIYPDLWITNHANDSATLYQNSGNGSFTDITDLAVSRIPDDDQHGAAWADFDNDGDQDLIQLVGGNRGTGSGSNQLYVNEGGILSDFASELGVDYPFSRGRIPLWFDFDRDGWLDLFAGAVPRNDGQAPPTIFRQTDTGFEDIRSSTGFSLGFSEFAFLADLSGDGDLEGVFGTSGNNTSGLRIYDLEEVPFENITTTTLLSSIERANDFAYGDFNGDLRTDVYITRGKIESDLVLDDPQTAKASIVAEGDRKGITIDTSGNIRFNFNFNVDFSLDDIYIGANGFNPDNKNVVLDQSDSNVEGISAHTPGVDRGIYIGYDSSQQQWQLFVSSPDRFNISTVISTDESISNLTPIGFDPDLVPDADRLLINTNEGLVDRSQESGINTVPIAGQNVVTGDFDNDMDLDLYIVNSGNAGNRENVLYDNQGNGTFVPIVDAGGAVGTNLGVGESVVTADYDVDGFLDLFVTNGNRSVRSLSRNAPYQLFRNRGNDNNWLEIDLEGVISNRDGIGAQVYVTAGGVTQLREQSGGIHNRTQNHQRLHFGLADNTKVDEILVRWSDGQEQTIKNVPANQLLHIIEPSESFTPGQPVYQVGSDSGIFVWKDTFDGPYHLRTVGAEDFTQFNVDLIATEQLQDVTPFSFEGSDKLEETDFSFSLDSQLFRGQDGVDFSLVPGSQALISVTQDGVANPRQLNFGREGNPLSPEGWILDSTEFPVKPNFTSGKDLGLFVGREDNSEPLEFRWNGDGNFHRTDLSVLSSADNSNFSLVSIESGDKVTTFDNGVTIEGGVSTWIDGLDVELNEPVKVGFTYEQDDLFPPQYVNPNVKDDSLELPNAYWLPLATPYGKPEYDLAQDSGVFLWKSEEDNLWRLRVTGGAEESSLRYKGSIVSDNAATSVTGVSLESSDRLNTDDPLSIDFDLRVFGGFQDGIDFSFAEGTAITLNLENPAGDTAALLRVGAEQWSVSELPLDLSGW